MDKEPQAIERPRPVWALTPPRRLPREKASPPPIRIELADLFEESANPEIGRLRTERVPEAKRWVGPN